MQGENKLFDKREIKYSVVMPLHKDNQFTDSAMDSVLDAIGTREDIEFLVLDDSNLVPYYSIDGFIQQIKLSKIDLLNKLIIGTQIAKGKYYCNVDYDDISHPKKFEMFDKLLETNDIVGANQCVFWDVESNKTYKMKDELKVRTHPYHGRDIKYPWLQHSNSAIPLKWLRQVGYDGGKKIGMAHIDKKIMTDSPIWARASMDGLKFGFLDDIDKNAWKQCWQIVHGNNVNTCTESRWKRWFDEVEVKKPEILR